jgi:hypothetical protein
MPRDQLTRKQRQMVRELDQIAALLRLNYHEIHEYERDSRSPRLQLVKDHFIRGEIVLSYTFIDEYLSMFLRDHFFGGRRANYRRLWKTKRFRNFNYFVIEKLSLMEKLAYVRAIRKVPKSVRQNIEQLNSLRNGLAHAFFPENLRSSKPKRKGLDIFSIQGIQRFVEDMADLDDFFVRRVYGIRST